MKDEQKRRENQNQAQLLFFQARTVAELICGEEVDLVANFPYWNETEIREIQHARTQARVDKMVADLMRNSIPAEEH